MNVTRVCKFNISVFVFYEIVAMWFRMLKWSKQVVAFCEVWVKSSFPMAEKGLEEVILARLVLVES